jgi:hypothetical protein
LSAATSNQQQHQQQSIMVFPSATTYINGHNKRPNGGPDTPPTQITTHTNVRLSLNPISNTIKIHTTTTLPLPPSIWGIRLSNVDFASAIPFSQKPQRHAPRADNSWTTHATWYRWSKQQNESFGPSKKGDVSIAIGEFADMDRLPDFDEMVAHPALLIPQKIPVDEDAIVPYFLNLVEAVPGEFNATQFFMAHNIPFHELRACVALHIWPHSIKLSPDQSDPYDIPNDAFCNSQILSQNCMSKPNKKDNDASFSSMENRLFGRVMDPMQDQSQAMHAFVDRHIHQLSNSCDTAQPLHNIITDSSSTPPRLDESTIQETPYGDEISSTSPNLIRPTIQETPDGDRPTIQETPDDDEISITPPYFNALPIQETPDDDETATPSERNISPQDLIFVPCLFRVH